MTIDTTFPKNTYTVTNIGPYPIPWPYADGTVIATVTDDLGIAIVMTAGDGLPDPVTSDTSGRGGHGGGGGGTTVTASTNAGDGGNGGTGGGGVGMNPGLGGNGGTGGPGYCIVYTW